MSAFQNYAKWLARLLFITWIGTFLLIDRLPPKDSISPRLSEEPTQKEITPQNYNVVYNGQNNNIAAVAEYEIHGLVVSHNDPKEWYRFDITHDDKSIDTRDFCIIWGDNLKIHDYSKVKFHNGDFYCGTRYSRNDTGFNIEQFSNNHLITDNQALRDKIAQVNIGDQVIIRGKLVNYSEERWNGFVRRSSLTRKDTEMGACEIIFVEDLQIIHSYNFIFALLHYISFWALIILTGIRFALFILTK